MRIDADGYLAARTVEERDDADLSAEAQAGDAHQESGAEPAAAPPAVAEAGVQTLRVMARDSEDIVRRFERPMRVASEPVERGTPTVLASAVQAMATPVTTAPAIAMPALPAAPPTLSPVAAAPATSGYVGERPVDASWLGDREKALTAIRTDYESARAQAQATPGSGPGWVAAVTVTDESGQVRSASGRPLVFIADANAPQVVAGYDESGPVYRPNGQWMEFDEDAFAAHYRAQGNAPLQSLAALYGTDSATLFTQHPEIWRIATSDHALNAGPPPAGRAMGDPGQLGMLDLYMADPQITGLIQAYGGQPQPATSDIAQEQVRIYGQQRYEQLTRLGHAMDSVRQQYTDAMAQAQASGAGPGWVERARTITVSDESGQQSTQTVYVTDESGQPLRDAAGQPQAVMERIFDPDAFTAWYEQQGGLQHEAFANFYGASHTTYATDESGRSFASTIAFDNPNWSLGGVGGAMGHKDLVGINPNDPPDLRNREAVGFDLEAGWATAHGNIKEKHDWFESVVQVAIVAAVSYVSAGTLGPAAAGAMGLSTTTVAGAMVSAAVAGAATSVASGMMSGNLTLKGVLQGALAGGLSAGLMTQFGPAVNAAAGSAGTLALRTTVQGGIQALLGGHFKDGALAGFAGGLADMASASMQANISEAVKNGTMDAAQASSARMFARVMGSAIRAMGNPEDPSHAFASGFLTDVMAQADQSVPAPAPAAEAPAAAPPAAPLSPVYGDTFAEDTAIRKSLDDPYGLMKGGRQPSPSGPVEFNPDDARLRWEETGVKPVYDFGDPLEIGGDVTAAAGGARTSRGGGARAPIEVSINQRSADILDALSNADALGLIPEAYRDIKQIAPLMAEAQRLESLEKIQAALRERLGPRVMPTPQDMGVLPGISQDPDGVARVRYDTTELIDRYSDGLRKVGLAQQGVIELDYRTFEVKTIGNQKLTPAQYIAENETRYQKAFAGAVELAEERYAAGKLNYPIDMPKQLQIGLFADAAARAQLLDYNKAIGVPEGPGQIISLNRWAYDMQGSGLYVRPDVLFDLGPSQRSWIDGKTTFLDTQTMTKQFEDFFRYTGATTGKVATPVGVLPVRPPKIKP